MKVERRDRRHKVILPARLRSGGVPVDMCVRDISARGICAVAAHAPARGTIVEVIGLPVPVIGTVVWTSEVRFGIALRGQIDPATLLAHRAEMAEILEHVSPPNHPDTARDMETSGEKSRLMSRAIQFLLLLVGVGCGAVLAASTAHHILSAPTQIISAVLDRHP